MSCIQAHCSVSIFSCYDKYAQGSYYCSVENYQIKITLLCRTKEMNASRSESFLNCLFVPGYGKGPEKYLLFFTFPVFLILWKRNLHGVRILDSFISSGEAIYRKRGSESPTWIISEVLTAGILNYWNPDMPFLKYLILHP